MRAMVRSVLSFLSKRPGNLLEGIPTEIAVLHETLHEELENIMPFLADEDENITVLASSIVHRLTTEDSLLWSSQTSDPASCDFHFYFCRSTLAFLSFIFVAPADCFPGPLFCPHFRKESWSQLLMTRESRLCLMLYTTFCEPGLTT
jgi:hypothetical protein